MQINLLEANKSDILPTNWINKFELDLIKLKIDACNTHTHLL